MKPEPETIIRNFQKILHGADYNPDQWLDVPEVIDEDFRLMRVAGCNTFALGIFAWTSYEPEEGNYRFDWLQGIMDRMASQGNKVILATPSGSKPAWMSKRYPEIRRVNALGLRDPHTRRHNHCWSSRIFREKVRSINTELGRRFGNHPALGMWHVSNEYQGHCYCDGCLNAFYQWLEKRYGDLDSLNRAWWSTFWNHTFTAWDEIHPGDASLDGMQVDWLRFNSWQIGDFYQFETQPLKAFSPEIPCTTNFMTLSPRIDYGYLSQFVDVVSDDQYPRFDPDDTKLVEQAARIALKHDLYRCFKPGKPWFLMESCPGHPQWIKPNRLKRPGMHRLEMLQAIAHGAEGTCYFQWRKGRGGFEKFHGAVVDHDQNEQNRVFRSVVELGALYTKLTPVLGSRVRARAALIFDWEVRWNFETSRGPASENDAYQRVAVDHYQSLWKRSISVDVLRREQDFSAYDLLILPQTWALTDDFTSRLTEFVRRGGTVVATHYTGITNDTNLCYTGGFPGNGLREVFGIVDEEQDCLHSDEVRKIDPADRNELGLTGSMTASEVCSVLHLEGADALATFASDFYAGSAAITVNTFGDGRAYYVGARLSPEDVSQFYDKLIQTTGVVESVVPFRHPEGINIQRRSTSDHDYYFVQNFTDSSHKLPMKGLHWKRVEDGAEITTELEIHPFESQVYSCRSTQRS
tara:strand:+ start:763 stop:2835 length:2073 start_codon:yes stop_codon:yes gene_type:complete